MLSILFILGMAILWRLGGSVDKLCRRIGAPVLLLVYGEIIHHDLWHSLLTLGATGALCGVTYLPITLVGDQEKENLLWICFLGLFHGMTLIPLTLLSHWWIGLIAMILVGLAYSGLIFLSVFSGYKFKWSYFELLFGAIYALAVTMII